MKAAKIGGRIRGKTNVAEEKVSIEYLELTVAEVAGDAALYVDPYSVESIAEATVRVCSEAGLPERLVEFGFARLKNFNWKKTAAKTLKVYRKLL